MVDRMSLSDLSLPTLRDLSLAGGHALVLRVRAARSAVNLNGEAE